MLAFVIFQRPRHRERVREYVKRRVQITYGPSENDEATRGERSNTYVRCTVRKSRGGREKLDQMIACRRRWADANSAERIGDNARGWRLIVSPKTPH